MKHKIIKQIRLNITKVWKIQLPLTFTIIGSGVSSTIKKKDTTTLLQYTHSMKNIGSWQMPMHVLLKHELEVPSNRYSGNR